MSRTLSYESTDGSAGIPVPCDYLVVSFDCEAPRATPLRVSLSESEKTEIGRGDERGFERTSTAKSRKLAIKLADKHLSSKHAKITKKGDRYELADAGSKNGTHLNGAKVVTAFLADGDLIEVGSTIMLFRCDAERLSRESPDADGAGLGQGLSTLSFSLARHLGDVSRCAPTELAILVTGASGVGKEVAARWLHQRSGRAGEFIGINCAALPETLVESELFGVKRGAFSGADRDRPGLIRAAANGTLFLDEIGELPPAVQVKLLRVLQEKEVVAVGDTEAVKVDVRFISATLQDVDAAVREGRFRADLLARVAGFRFHLPPLLERREDIGGLIGLLIERIAPGVDVRFERDAGRALLAYDWPLNVRELEQTLRSAIALAEGSRIGLAHLPEAVADAAEPGRQMADGTAEDPGLLSHELEAMLKRHKGNISAISREMGRARTQIRRWCNKFGLDIEAFR